MNSYITRIINFLLVKIRFLLFVTNCMASIAMECIAVYQMKKICLQIYMFASSARRMRNCQHTE